MDVRHYTLSATAETLHSRLRRRGSAYLLGKALRRDETWAIGQIERCVDALAGERYATRIETDELTPGQVTELIAHDAGLELVAPRLPPVLERVRRLEIGVRHIRI